MYMTIMTTFLLQKLTQGFETWSPVLVDKDSLDGKRLETFFVDFEIMCAMHVSRLQWAHMACYDQGQCLASELKRFPRTTALQFTNPETCFTRLQLENPGLDCIKETATHLDEFGCVWINEENLSFEDASDTCKSLSGDLISFAGYTTNVELETTAAAIGISAQHHWIGATKENQSSSLTWMTGEILPNNHRLFAPGQPDEIITDFCVLIRADARYGDNPCSALYPSICVFPKNV